MSKATWRWVTGSSDDFVKRLFGNGCRQTDVSKSSQAAYGLRESPGTDDLPCVRADAAGVNAHASASTPASAASFPLTPGLTGYARVSFRRARARARSC